MKLFAAKAMCPWRFIRILIHAPKFKHTIHAFEELVRQFVDDVNACIPEADRRTYGLDKEAFLSAISKALCLNMVPGLHLSDAAIPKLEQKLELVDSFYDPVCLFEHPDEDETPGFGAARMKYRVIIPSLLTTAYTVTVVDPATGLRLHRESRRHAHRQPQRGVGSHRRCRRSRHRERWHAIRLHYRRY